MIRVGVCSECGTPFEWDDAEENPTVCGECNLPDEDLISFFDIEDIYD
jgi:rubrerythrin